MSWTAAPEVEQQLMTTGDVQRYTNGLVKESTLRWWRHEGKGQGPKSFKIGARKVAYRKSDVDAWLAAQYSKES